MLLNYVCYYNMVDIVCCLKYGLDDVSPVGCAAVFRLLLVVTLIYFLFPFDDACLLGCCPL